MIEKEGLKMFFVPFFYKKLKQEEYKHIIITHFNLDYSLLNYKNVPKEQYKNPEWLSHRFELFEKYCYPSIQQQTNKNFIWLCTFHKDTPEPFVSKIKEYEQNCEQMKISYAEHFSAYEKDISELVKLLVPRTQYLVTTRLDNDDSLAIDYIDEIQKRLYQYDGYFIDFWYGFTYDVLNRVPYYIKTRRNPFSTRVEKWENAKTIKVFNHTLINRYAPVLNVKTKPMWAQIIHGENVLNKVDGDKFEETIDFKNRFVFCCS